MNSCSDVDACMCVCEWGCVVCRLCCKASLEELGAVGQRGHQHGQPPPQARRVLEPRAGDRGDDVVVIVRRGAQENDAAAAVAFLDDHGAACLDRGPGVRGPGGGLGWRREKTGPG